MNQPTYVTNIIDFTSAELKFLTLATIAGIVTFKFLGRLYDEVYDPIMHSIIPDEYCTQIYYIGNVPVRPGYAMREFVKWLVLVIIIMFIYNLIKKN